MPNALTPLTTPWLIKALTMALGVAIVVLTVELIRRDLLRTAYALLWLLAGLVVIVVGIFPNVVGWLQRLTGMNYQTAMLFVIFGFVLLLLMQFSVIISRLSHRNKDLAQDLALLRQQLHGLRQDRTAPPGSPPPPDDRSES